MAKRVLIFGATGFLGKHAVTAFRKTGWEVSAVGTADGDLCDPAEAAHLIRRYGPDTVVHLAARCGGIGLNQREPFTLFHDNLVMGANVLRACAVLHARLVLAGTVCGYGAAPRLPFKESEFWDGFPEPTNAGYGIAKKALLAGLDAARQQHGLRGVYLIPANLYGPGDSFDQEKGHVIPAIVRKVVEAQEAGVKTVELWGTGTATRDFLYVADCAQALVKAAEKEDIHGPVNLGTGQEWSVGEVAAEVAQFVGWNGEFLWNQKKPDGQARRVLDCRRAWKLLSWHAETPLERGLSETIRWFQENR